LIRQQSPAPRKAGVELYSKPDQFGVRLLKPHKACSKRGAMAPYTEMVAPAAALVGRYRSNLCRDNRSCSVAGSAATKRASGVLSGIFRHEDYRFRVEKGRSKSGNVGQIRRELSDAKTRS
jgi:hypothetical protein